ncbi:Zinc finger MYM-type protein 1 [Frankliniella fusca]|uniref:Zinc finger MYM-type protein 1 n=1 Tax=Frankliniella fusca TaxID=407009 RepID=A0AAE1GQV1_9NEOP|nr:Zinc finger MYM-type protein 1 [Frankliniella fusca]
MGSAATEPEPFPLHFDGDGGHMPVEVLLEELDGSNDGVDVTGGAGNDTSSSHLFSSYSSAPVRGVGEGEPFSSDLGGDGDENGSFTFVGPPSGSRGVGVGSGSASPVTETESAASTLNESCLNDINFSSDKDPSLNADPASFCHIKSFSPTTIDILLSLGPNQPSEADLRAFEKGTRHFRPQWYYLKLPDGNTHKRDWLSYSPKNDKVYCLHCILFGSNKATGSSKPNLSFTANGFNSWKNATASFILHETSNAHIECTLAANMRKLSLPLNLTAEASSKTARAQNREIVRHLIDVTLFLAKHCLAFRGHREGKQADLKGNFRDLVALLGKYSPAMATYLAKINSSKKRMRNFLSWKRQNQYISCIASFIKSVIKNEISTAKFFSVSMDETFDASRKEQVSCIIRYVSEETGTVVERLVALKESCNTSGQELFDVLKKIFEELNLDWRSYLVGQAYDGASNMRGAYNGLQTLVRNECDTAVYVWCWAHRLSLAVKEAADCCLDSAVLFKNLKALYNVINGSKINVEIYEKAFKKCYPGKQVLCLKRVDTTRWMSHSAALSTVIKSFDAIVETLEKVQNNASGEMKASAHGALTYLLSEKFVCTALTFNAIYDEVDPLNKALQAVDLDLLSAQKHVNVVLDNLKKIRTDEAFQSILRQKDEFISKCDENLQFAKFPIPHRRVRRRDGEKALDDPIVDAEKKVRVDMYFKCLDTIISLISERFNDRSQALFKDLALFTRHRISEVKESPYHLPEDAFKAFCKIYGKFVSIEDIQREYKQFVKVFSEYEAALALPLRLHSDDEWIDLDEDDEADAESREGVSSQRHEENEDTAWQGFDAALEKENNLGEKRDTENNNEKEFQHSGSMAHVLRVLHSAGLRGVFPSLYVALRIAVTLPVTSASTERSFSKLKLIKTRLRTTMSQPRLEDLMIIACEYDIPIDSEKVLELFTSLSKYLQTILYK